MLSSCTSLGTKSSWESTSPKVSLKKSCISHVDDEKISLIIGGENYQVGTSTPLKTLFNEYTEKQSVSLKSLRFSYGGKTLFVSTAGRKTPIKLGMLDCDTIEIQSNNDAMLRDDDKSGSHKDK